MSSFSGIKSIQRGTIGANTTATISSVDTSKTVLNYLGISMSTDSTRQFVRIALTDSTTITSTAGLAGGSVSFEVVEYY